MQLLRLFFQIALRRSGPQDLPASPVLLAITVLAFLLANAVTGWLLPPVVASWFAQLCVEIVLTLAWCAILLRSLQRSERFLQTATALFGYQLIFTPLLIAVSYLMHKIPQESAAFKLVLMVVAVLMVGLIAAGAQVFKAAIEWSTPASVALFILQIVSIQLLLLMAF
jgi:hypothetical protein